MMIHPKRKELLTWWPVDIGPVCHLVTVALALPPAVRGDQGAGRRLRAGHQVVGAVRVLQLMRLARGSQVGT